MNIDLDYDGKHYNIDIPKNVKLDYLLDLSSKLFKSDKTLIDLIYNNKKIDSNNENLLIHDLIPKGKSSTILTVQMNEDNQKEKINTKLSEDKTIKNKEIKNEELSNNGPNYNIQAYNNKNKKILKYNNTNNNIVYENGTFIAYYIKKSNELFLMMKEFNDKVKLIDNNLNKKKKYFDIDSDNNIFYYEVSLFEKRLIDFLNIQIKFYKELLQILNNEDKETHEINFDIFYNKILLFNNEGFNNDKEDVPPKNNRNRMLPNIRKINSISVKKINNLNDSFNTVFPMLKSINSKTKKSLILKDKDKFKINIGENKIFRYIDKNKLIKIKNNILAKSFKKNLRTENNNNNNYELNDGKEK